MPVIITVYAVPVPPAFWLFGSGLLRLLGIARRKNTWHHYRSIYRNGGFGRRFGFFTVNIWSCGFPERH